MWFTVYLVPKFHDSYPITFGVIMLTDRQTKRQSAVKTIPTAASGGDKYSQKNHRLKLGTHYPCARAVSVNTARVNTCDTLLTNTAVNTGAIFDTRVYAQ